SDVPRKPPPVDGSDSALAGTLPVFTTHAIGAPAVGIVLLDGSEHVRGVVYGIGGENRRTVWYDAGRMNPKWATVLDQLHGTDSSANGNPRDATVARGPIRAIPLEGGVAFAQSAYSWRAQGAPTLLHVSLMIGDTVRVGSTLAQLVGMTPTTLPNASAPATSDLRARAALLYTRMRDAMRRGDWTAFGAAFDELGRLLG